MKKVHTFEDALQVRDINNFLFQVNFFKPEFGNIWNTDQVILVDYVVPDDKDLELECITFVAQHKLQNMPKNYSYLLKITDISSNKVITDFFDVGQVSPRVYTQGVKRPYPLKHILKSRSIIRFEMKPLQNQINSFDFFFGCSVAVKCKAYANHFTP